MVQKDSKGESSGYYISDNDLKSLFRHLPHPNDISKQVTLGSKNFFHELTSEISVFMNPYS